MTNTPEQVRHEMIRGLRRSMLGPASSSDIGWPGEELLGRVVDSPDFEAEGFPTGPWTDSKGREVIHRNPIFTYPVGVLYPKLGSYEREKLATEVLGDDDEDSDIPDGSTSDDGSPDMISSDDEEVAKTDSRYQGPRTMSFSVRLADHSRSVPIWLSGGVYEPIKVQGGRESWWAREPVEANAVLRVGEEKILPVRDDLNLTVGITRRSSEGAGGLVTIWVRNEAEIPHGRIAAEFSIFQVRFRAEFTELLPISDVAREMVDGLELLYHERPHLATGHGCDVLVTHNESGITVETDSLPVVEVAPLSPDISDDSGSLAVGMSDLAAFNEDARACIERIFAGYAAWIDGKKSVVDDLESRFRVVARDHLQQCRQFLEDAQYGWHLAQADADVRLCLQLASRAMNDQRVAFGRPLREARGNSSVNFGPISTDSGMESRWRPFQIVFILASLRKVVDLDFRKSTGRDVDVIWMPTGGGKTEAYLGLAAFTILWSRLTAGRKESKPTASMQVLMRYTYRLLTVQQVARAASLICALELIRRSNVEAFGDRELRIGAWLGGSVTSNSREIAITALGQLRKGEQAVGMLLKKCPWCGAQMREVFGGSVLGYSAVTTSNGDRRVLAHCPDDSCEFSKRERLVNGQASYQGIPFLEVDEDIYQVPPDFVIATIDKTAQLAYRPNSHRIFGLQNGKRVAPPPRLLIQDELHLITGPLGSLNGVFEVAVEHLCTYRDGQPPVYVASTATTKEFHGQLDKLYGRGGRLVPPPGLSIDDSFFTRRDPSQVGKMYVGVCSTGGAVGTDLQVSVLASLAYHAGVLGPDRLCMNVDSWWTNMVFFSSRRTLGQLTSLVDTLLHSRIARLRALSGRRSGRVQDSKDSADRRMRNLPELTATSSEDVNEVFDSLETGLPDSRTVDICFATSMVEVGLDVGRLGLMTVVNQPKSASTYIQATGRVGRSGNAPGLVVVVLQSANVRDLSHYEGFRNWHNRLYASVESASVTPFTTRALERSLPSFMAIVLRSMVNSERVRDSQGRWSEAAAVLLDRVKADATATRNVQAVLDDLHRRAFAQDASEFVWDVYVGRGQALMYSSLAAIPDERLGSPFWLVMNSMRSVESDTMMKVVAESSSVPRGKGGKRDEEARDPDIAEDF